MFASLWMTALLGAVAGGAALGGGEGDLFSRLDANGDGRVERSETPASESALFDRLLRNADRDGDGALNTDEFARGLRPSIEPKPIEQAAPQRYGDPSAVRLLLLKLDTDRDTRLTRREAPQSLRSAYDGMVREFDATKDGSLDLRELAQAGPKLLRTAQRIAGQQRWDVTAELAKLERSQGKLADRFDEPPSREQVLGDPARARALFAQLDANGDGKLRADEVPEPLQDRLGPMIRRADRDGDRAMSREEFLTVVDRMGRLMRMAETPPLSPSAPDSRPKSKAIKKSIGESKRGDERELASRLIAGMIERGDRNNNGVLETDEAVGRLADRFQAADANGDGRLDQTEVDQMTEVLAKRLARAAKKSQPSD